ncbi:MAG: hypothetical protein ACI9QD_000180 [Thermoproteota archaeon]|jgi:hypothetical protein
MSLFKIITFFLIFIFIRKILNAVVVFKNVSNNKAGDTASSHADYQSNKKTQSSRSQNDDIVDVDFKVISDD